MKKHDSAEPEPWRRSLEAGRQIDHNQVGSPGDLQISANEEEQSFLEIPLQEYLSTVDFPPVQQGNSQVEEDLLWDCFGSLQGSTRAADDADQPLGGQWAAGSTPSVRGEAPGPQGNYTSSGTEGIVEHFSILVGQSEPKEQELSEEMSLEALFPDLSPSDSLETEVKAKGDEEGSLKAQRIELKKQDSAKPQQKPRRRSLEVGRETLHPEVGYLGKLWRSPSPQKIKRRNEDSQPISLLKFSNTVESPPAKQGNSPVVEDCFEGFLPGEQSTAESISRVSGEAPEAQRNRASSGTEGIVEHLSILADQSEPKEQELSKVMSLEALFPDLSPSDSLETEVKAKGDEESSLKAQRIELKKQDSAKPQQKPQRRSLGVGRRSFEPKVPEVLEERSLKTVVKAKDYRKVAFKGPVSDSEEDNLRLRRPERSSQTQESPCRVEVMTLNAAEIEEAPGIQQSLETCAQLDPVRRESFIADKHSSEATSCVRETGDTKCGESYRQSSDLLEIQQITKDYLCSVYGRSYSTSSGFSRHGQTHAEEKPYPCSECGRKFRTNSTLSAHKQIHTSEKKYKCPECGESYRTSCDFSSHKRSHSKEKPYKCSVCGKCYSRKYNLLDHLHIHTGEKPYKCSECGKSYSCHSSLSRHIRSHREENQYKCSVCGRSYNRRYRLLAHRCIHTGEKLYECSEHGSFRTRSNFLAH